MVTAELAAALPALALVLIAAVWGVVYAATQLRCADAAREAARAAARGEDMSTIVEIAETIAPGHADVDVQRKAGLVIVEVQASVMTPPPLRSALGPSVSGRAIALEEGP